MDFAGGRIDDHARRSMASKVDRGFTNRVVDDHLKIGTKLSTWDRIGARAIALC